MRNGVPAVAASITAVFLAAAGCSRRATPTAASPAIASPAVTTRPPPVGSLPTAVAAIATPLTLIQDDLGINGTLNVPQNRYNIDIDKLIAAVQMARSAKLGTQLTNPTQSDLDDLLASASSLISLLQKTRPTPGPTGVTALDSAASALALVQHDLGPSS
jgi:hypothetical protein